MATIAGILREVLRTFIITSRSILRMRNISDTFVQEIKHTFWVQ